MNYVSANNKYHVPLHVNPILLKKGGVTNAKVIIILKLYKSGICSFVARLKVFRLATIKRNL